MADQSILGYILVIIVTVSLCVVVVPLTTPMIEEILGTKKEMSIHRTYFDKESESYEPTSSSFVSIPDLSITCQVEAEENVYCVFTCEAVLNHVSAVMTINFRFSIDDGTSYTDPITLGHTGGTSTNNHYSVVMQDSLPNLSEGTHEIIVEIAEDGGANAQISLCCLLVQTYK